MDSHAESMQCICMHLFFLVFFLSIISRKTLLLSTQLLVIQKCRSPWMINFIYLVVTLPQMETVANTQQIQHIALSDDSICIVQKVLITFVYQCIGVAATARGNGICIVIRYSPDTIQSIASTKTYELNSV